MPFTDDFVEKMEAIRTSHASDKIKALNFAEQIRPLYSNSRSVSEWLVIKVMQWHDNDELKKTLHEAIYADV